MVDAVAPEPLPAVPFGAWPSPIAAADLVSGWSTPIEAWAQDGLTWWAQTRPDQGGRQQVQRRDGDGSVHEALPESWNARTRVHEYGGAGWWANGDTVFAVNFADQRLYRAEPGRPPVALTPVPLEPAGERYADGRVTPDGGLVICVRESHRGPQVRNEIVAIAAAAPGAATPSEPVVLRTGPDFVAAPRISPDGARLAWIEWQHPNMPWDSTQLWVGELVQDAASRGLASLTGVRQVAGRDGESLLQPEWGPDGALYVVSDSSDWWNVYRVPLEPAPGEAAPPAPAPGQRASGQLVPVHPVTAEVGLPAWVFGQSRYLVAEGAVWFTYSADDGAHLVRVGAGGEASDDVLPFVGLGDLRLGRDPAGGERIVAIALQLRADPAVIEIRRTATGLAHEVLREPYDDGLDPHAVAIPRRIAFPSAGGRSAHAVLWMPTSATAAGPAGTLPPLLVNVHGGPTANTSPAFRLSTQYWTSRGFAFVSVDYGGSTGYGRPYRRLLDGAWGIVDIEDACAAAEWLAGQGLVDPDRMAIRGGSAGGYTTLAALATRDVFAAGASYFGVADLGALVRETHKFESRYLDGLIGPWPEALDVYTERSPLSHIDGFDRPLIVLQGDEDAVVPPAQAEMIVKALAAKGVPHAYLLFAGEQHGFRQAGNIIRANEAELSFYAQVFGFEPAEVIEPVQIEFADRLRA